MSLVTLSHVCSHLQNASRARLGMTAIPSSNLNLRVALALQKNGFISTVQRGSLNGPDPGTTPEPVTRENVSSRRLWLGMKYYKDAPVLNEMKMISKPSRRIWVKHDDLENLIRGRDSSTIKGLNPGECLFLSTDRGIIEAREAVKKQIGGQLLCRVY